MNFCVIDRGCLNLAAWEILAQRGSFFHTTSWMDICLAGLPGAHRGIFLCGYDGDELVAGMPGLITRRLGFESFYSMPYGTYGAALFSGQLSENQRREFFDSLALFFRKSRFSEVVVVDFGGSLHGWSGHKMKRVRHFTHLISLDNPGEYRPRPNVESDLRTGRKRQSEIFRISDTSQVDDFYRLYHLSRKRHGGGPDPGKKFFEAVFSRLNNTDSLYWTGINAEGAMIGSQIHFIHGDTLINWQTVSDYEKRRYKPNHLLMDDAICLAAGKGLKKINLGASPPEAPGLVFYKEHWQGVRTEYDILSVRSWWRQLLRR